MPPRTLIVRDCAGWLFVAAHGPERNDRSRTPMIDVKPSWGCCVSFILGKRARGGRAVGGRSALIGRCRRRPSHNRSRRDTVFFVLLSPRLLVDLAFKVYALHHVFFHKTQNHVWSSWGKRDIHLGGWLHLVRCVVSVSVYYDGTRRNLSTVNLVFIPLTCTQFYQFVIDRLPTLLSVL